MRLRITLNMPSQKGNLVHQILCEYNGATSLEQVVDYLESHDFIIVDQYYMDNDTREMTLNGKVALHRMVIGKIEEWRERR